LIVLVIGGAGYIGSHAARTLKRRGHEVVIYDNLSTGHAFLAEGFQLIVGQIADTSKLAPIMGRVDAVMHFAGHAYVGESVENPRKYFRNNVEAGLALLNICLDCGVRKFIFSSTCAVYGVPSKIPITEDNPRLPVNPYGVSKLFFERALEAYDQAYGLRFAALRYFNAAGCDESGEIGELHANPSLT
jgi:UDP-glucose 4-epimerase